MSLKWVKLKTLEEGQSFLDREGLVGLVKPPSRQPNQSIVTYHDGRLNYRDADIEVLPLDPKALADDLAELAFLRLCQEDRREACWPLLLQERALEREACARVADGEYDPAPNRYATASPQIAKAIRSLGDPPAPERLEAVTAERDKLRAEMYELLAVASGAHVALLSPTAVTPSEVNRLGAAVKRAREVMGEAT